MKKLNNKGFSLVELIIVIAIMAILVGVVGTQVIPYLENSRKAKDTQIFSAWNTAGVSAYSTEAGNLDATATYVIKVAPGSVTESSGKKGSAKIRDTFCELTNLKTDAGYVYADMASKAGKEVDYVTITINGGNGDVITEAHMKSGSTKSFDLIENK